MNRPRKTPVPTAYRDTSVPASRTRDAIAERLRKVGASATAWEFAQNADRHVMRLRFQLRDRVYRFAIDLGSDARDERQRMRALWWCIKTACEQDEFGIFRMETLLLAMTEVMLPDGSHLTVEDLVGEQLAAARVPTLEPFLQRALPGTGKGQT
jgi:hypothetical protein